MSSEATDWRARPDELGLGPNEVQVWRIALEVPDGTVHRQRACLDAGEIGRLERLRGHALKRRFAVSHGVTRQILGSLLDAEPARLRFREGRRGKPALTEPRTDLEFNLTHSHELALLAVTRGRRLGVDVERIRPFESAARLAERFFCESEEEALAALPPEARERAFFDAWTRKEAFIKARGEAVFGWLHRFEVSLLPGEPARIVRVDDDAHEAARWRLEALEPLPEYTGALVVEGHDVELTRYRWP